MSGTVYREALDSDLDTLAAIRAAEWGDEDYWRHRIRGYATGVLNPQKALPPRVILIAADGDQITGFIAGHLTQRFDCDGELEWLNVIPDQRRTGVARGLLLKLVSWFADHGARRICVDADPDNPAARAFYRKNGAEDLNPHWLVWPDITEIALEHQRLDGMR